MMTEDQVSEILMSLANYWRESDLEYAQYYVDAYLSAHASIFGYYFTKEGIKTYTDSPKDLY